MYGNEDRIEWTENNNARQWKNQNQEQKHSVLPDTWEEPSEPGVREPTVRVGVQELGIGGGKG